MTAVAVDQLHDSKCRTALWAKSPVQGWVNVDVYLALGDIVIFVGEDFERLGQQLGSPIEAVMHCTRVDPNAERLVRFDNLPDPQSERDGNRVSVAFVLSDGVE